MALAGTTLRAAGLLAACIVFMQSSALAALLDAAESGNTAAALAEIASGGDVNLRGGDGSTALMWAAYNGDARLVVFSVRCAYRRRNSRLCGDGNLGAWPKPPFRASKRRFRPAKARWSASGSSPRSGAG